MPNDNFESMDLGFSLAEDAIDFNPLPFIEKAAKEKLERIMVDGAPSLMKKAEDEPPANGKEKVIDEKDLPGAIPADLKQQKQPEIDTKELDDLLSKQKAPAAAASAAQAGSEDGGGDPPLTPYQLLYDDLIEAGEWEPMEDFDGTEESFQLAKQHNIELQVRASLDQIFEKALKANPDSDKAKLLLQHLANGGRISNFIDNYSDPEFTEDMLAGDDDAENENVAEDIQRQYYASIGWTPERIDTKIARDRKLGIIVESAKDVLPEYNRLVADRRELYKNKTEADKKNREADAIAFNQSIIGLLQKGGSVSGLPIKNDRKSVSEMQQYLFARDHDVNGIKTSKFYADLVAASKKPEWTLMQAIILRDGLKLEDIEQKSENKAKRGIQDKLEQYARAERTGNRTESRSENNSGKKQNSMGINFDEDLVKSFLM